MKSYFDMTTDERKEALAQGEIDRQALLTDAIENAPKYKAEAAQAKLDQVAAQIAEHERQLKQSVRSSYIVANGSEQGFDDVWLSLREEVVKRQTIENAGTSDLVTQFIQKLNSR